MTLTLDFQGQILKMLYVRNGRADWHGTKGMWVDRMLDPHCDFELWPHPWPSPLIFKVKFWKSHNSGTWCPIDMERKGCESTQGQILKKSYLSNGMPDWHGTKGMWVDRMLDPPCHFELWPHPWPWPLIFKVKFWKSHNSGTWCPIDMERKGCESTECRTHVMTFYFDLTHDLDLEFSTANFETAVSQECQGRSTWNKRDVSR